MWKGSFFDNVPNEVLRQLLSHLSLIQLTRVNLLWRFLGNSGLIPRATLKAEYPYLITEEGLENLTPSECIALLEKQRNIYVELATKMKIMPEYLQRSYLEDFFDPNQSRKNNKFSLEPNQIIFLKSLAVASDIITDISDEQKSHAFVLMAIIDNAKKLTEWAEIHKEKISSDDKEGALWEAARKGHVACVAPLVDKCGEVISAEQKGLALWEAARKGQVACVRYLIDTCSEVISKKHKQEAYIGARIGGHVQCMACLSRPEGEIFSNEGKRAPLDALSSSASNTLIFTSPSNLNDTRKKRKREEENNNNDAEERPSSKMKKTPEESTKSNWKWPFSCPFM